MAGSEDQGAAVALESLWESAVMAGDLSAADPRSDLERLRAVVSQAIERERDLGPLFHGLSEVDPIALADLAVGPRAPAGGSALSAALAVADCLEEQMSVGALYRRLAVLAGERRGQVLAQAAARHPAAGWLLALSESVEGERAGLCHLRSAAGHPAFAQCCWAYASKGHCAALTTLAEETGRVETVAALLANEQQEAALEAATRLLERHSAAHLPAFVAAVWGPELDGFFVKLVCGLRSRGAAERLLALDADLPRTHSLLRAVIPGLHPVEGTSGERTSGD